MEPESIDEFDEWYKMTHKDEQSIFEELNDCDDLDIDLVDLDPDVY